MSSAPFERFLQGCTAIAAGAEPLALRGRLTRASGLVLEAIGLRLPVGAQVTVTQDDGLQGDAEVVGFSGERLFLMPLSEMHGIRTGAIVMAALPDAARPRLDQANHPRRRAEDRGRHLPMGDALLGRVIDAAGRPLDGLGELAGLAMHPLARRPINSMDRAKIVRPLDVGVRAINALLTIGRGQRIGLFAGSGVG
jgi:flagellum-specific ATP synthase